MAAAAPVEIPATFRELVAGRPPEPEISGDDWLRALPRLVSGALSRWSLVPDGAPHHGLCALVVPVRDEHGTPAALKVTWPHAEARDEHLALRAWGGRGAVELLAADPGRSTMLLARLDAERSLVGVDLAEACEVIGTLLRTLRRPALPQLARLSGWGQRTLAAFDSPAAGSLPRRFLAQGRSVLADLLSEDVDTHLLHTDLHYENVLAGPDGWLAIDPKPMSGDPAFEVWPALHNRLDPRGAGLAWDVHSRLGWVCEAAELDEDRARSWALIRTLADALHAARSGDDARLGARIMLAKALSQRW